METRAAAADARARTFINKPKAATRAAFFFPPHQTHI